MSDFIGQQAATRKIPRLTFIGLTVGRLSTPQFRMIYSPWGGGGFYTNVIYPSGAVGCITSARHTVSGMFEITCDERAERGQYKTREAAAQAERLIALAKWQEVAKREINEANQK